MYHGPVQGKREGEEKEEVEDEEEEEEEEEEEREQKHLQTMHVHIASMQRWDPRTQRTQMNHKKCQGAVRAWENHLYSD